jgi:hypothetical protein
LPDTTALQVPFAFSDKVFIDGDKSITARVTGFWWKDDDKNYLVEVSWMHNGTSQTAWMQPWRLDLC